MPTLSDMFSCEKKKFFLSLFLTTNISKAYLAGKNTEKTLWKMCSGKQLLPRMSASALISTSGDWRMKAGSEHVALESPRGTPTYCARSHTSCQDQHLVWVDLGGRDWHRSCPWSPAGILLPCHFYFLLLYFIFLFFGGKSRETQTGYSELNCVIRLKQKQTLGSQGFYQ